MWLQAVKSERRSSNLRTYSIAIQHVARGVPALNLGTKRLEVDCCRQLLGCSSIEGASLSCCDCACTFLLPKSLLGSQARAVIMHCKRISGSTAV